MSRDEPVGFMLASSIKEPFDDEAWIFEIKWDGYRCMAMSKRGQVSLVSRNGKSLNERFESIRRALAGFRDVVLDGEVVILDEKGNSSFQALQSFLQNGRGQPMYQVFDLLFLDGQDWRQRALLERKEKLKSILPKHPQIKYSDYIQAQGRAMFSAAKQAGLEGIMAKRADSPYRSGVRSNDWLKIKTVNRQEVIVVGYTEPRGARKKLGALVVGEYRNGRLEFAGHVGVGFTDWMLDDAYLKLQPLKTRKSALENQPKTNTRVQWVEPELVCEVSFREWTDDGLLRQPIFLGWRDDKEPQAVIREQAASANFFGATALVSETGSAHLEVGGKSLDFTHLNKIFWPNERYTKGDLLDYYRSVAKYILPYLRNRPLSLYRFPEGIAGERFYQKDLIAAPDWVRTIAIRSEDNRVIQYMICDDEAALLYQVQLGCIDIHPWNSRVESIEFPDYAVIDLDNEGRPFRDVIKTALVVKQVLDDFRIISYCKTSGATGLHIYIPLEAKYTYEQTRLWVEILMHLVNKQLPRITSLERNPDKRQNLIYLDYLQNRRGQTMAAPYSVRPLPGAPVSMPLDWDEIEYGLDPLSFNLKNSLTRLERVGDLWKPVLGKGIDLARVLERLKRLRTRG